LRSADEVTVIVCDHADQTIQGVLRASWLREIHPTARVIVVPDNVPADDSKAWADYTLQVLGYHPDVVFTSEAYGEAYAHHLNARHVSVDPHRALNPISGSMIRSDPFGHWEFLEPCVRAYFAARIVVIGAESTGTTTMARALAEHFCTAWVPEFGRSYWEGKLTGGDSAWTTDEFTFIATQQNRFEDQLARVCNKLLICDTDSFATSIWHERYMESSSDEVDALSRGRAYALYLLTDIDAPFTQDGTRDGAHIREHMHMRFEEELQRRGKPYVLLTGDHRTRLLAAIEACDRVITSTASHTS
jgi:NadR type nicotinamide-nucleotide adenylyltransferase